MVLDAKTLLVLLRGEAGQDRVIRASPRAVLDDICTVLVWKSCLWMSTW
jgi:PIN domain nuclease of toxin-antitoxin system